MKDSFDWHPSHRLLYPKSSSSSLRKLKDLVRSRQSFRVGSSGPSALCTATPPVLHCETSGTSGQPKIIERTQASWRRNFAINGRRLKLSRTDRIATFGHIGHSLVLYATLEAAATGAGLMDLQALRPDRQVEVLKQHRASVLYLTPTQLGQLCAHGTRDVNVRLILVGGGILRPAVQAAAARVFPNARVIQFYGAAETSFITWSDDTTPEGSVGRAYPEVSLSVRDAVDGIGEIWVKSPFLFERYAAGTSSDTRRNGAYLSLGELGRIDADGYVFVTGRKSRMVTICDINVYPEEVEACLSRHVAARHIVVLANPDPKRGHVLVAVIAGCETPPDTDALLAACRRDLGPLKTPRAVRVLPEMPLLPAGKPDLGAIRTLLAAAL